AGAFVAAMAFVNVDAGGTFVASSVFVADDSSGEFVGGRASMCSVAVAVAFVCADEIKTPATKNNMVK
ncbi:MAG TPA: hypothetical protein VMO20_01600, partial [Candidatus Acidoferrum sp.]|nr:hypothetical protein [Candidatus Acidoferrum sp.]